MWFCLPVSRPVHGSDKGDAAASTHSHTEAAFRATVDTSSETG